MISLSLDNHPDTESSIPSDEPDSDMASDEASYGTVFREIVSGMASNQRDPGTPLVEATALTEADSGTTSNEGDDSGKVHDGFGSDSGSSLADMDYKVFDTDEETIPCVARFRYTGLEGVLNMRFVLDYRLEDGDLENFVYQREDHWRVKEGHVYIDPAMDPVMEVPGYDVFSYPMLKVTGFIHAWRSGGDFPLWAEFYAKRMVRGEVYLEEREVREMGFKGGEL